MKLARLFLLAGVLSSPLHAHAAHSCGGGSPPIRCFDPDTYPVFVRSFSAVNGTTYTVETSSLATLPGHANTADTLVYLLNSNTGSVVAIDDDGAVPARASLITFTASSSFTAVVVVTGYSDTSYGSCTTTVTNQGTGLPVWSQSAWFGGWRETFDVKSGDRFFVGVSPDGQSHTIFTNKAFIFTSTANNCTSSCGTYQESDSSVSLLSRIFVNFTDSTSRLLVGSATPTSDVSTRAFHSRLGAGWGAISCPSTNARADCDSDGLTYEIEGLSGGGSPEMDVDTCDSASGPSANCNAGRNYSSRANWNARDSDNDGLDDPAEIFGIRKRCTATPALPYNYGGTCLDGTWDTTSASYMVSTALSALDPDPTEVDVFALVEPQTGGWLANGEWATIEYIYDTEGTECEDTTATTCVQPHYRQVLHIVQGATVPAMNYDRHILRPWPAFDYFNVNLAGYRKHTGVYRYGQLLTRENFAWGRRRTFVAFGSQVPNTDQNSRPRVFAHEVGHVLGLAHGGTIEETQKANYPSIMNYRFMPVKPASGSLWPSTFPAGYQVNCGPACAGGGVCSAARTCTGGTTPGAPCGTCAAGLTCSSNRCAQACVGCPVGDTCVAGFCSIAGTACIACPAGLGCNTLNFCDVDCSQAAVRFSRGSQPTLNETVARTETVSDIWAADLSCYQANGNQEGEVLYAPWCSGGACACDWNNDWDRVDASALPADPFDGDGNLLDTSLADNNDWLTMYDLAKDRILPVDGSGNPLPKNLYWPYFRVYQSAMDTAAAADMSAFAQTVTATGVTTGASANNAYGSSLDFDGVCSPGPCTTDNISIAADDSLESMGASVLAGVGPNGYRVDAFVNFDQVNAGYNKHQIIKSDLFDIYVGLSLGAYYITVGTNNGSSWSFFKNLSLALQPSQWYWVTLMWNKQTGLARLYVTPWGTTDWNFASGACATNTHIFSAGVDPGTITIGLDPASPSYAMKGLIDEVKLFNFSGCIGHAPGNVDQVQEVTCPGGVSQCAEDGLDFAN